MYSQPPEPSKKSLRRKPPPLFEEPPVNNQVNASTSYNGGVFGDLNRQTPPVVPPRPRPGSLEQQHVPRPSVPRPQLNHHQSYQQGYQQGYQQPYPQQQQQQQLSPIYQLPYPQQQQQSSIYQQLILAQIPLTVPEILHDLSYIEDSYNDSFQSLESPKPMGPKQLPEYDQSYNNNRSAPYPVEDIPFVLSSEALDDTPTTQSVYFNPNSVSSPNQYPPTTTQIIYDATTTPTKAIPPLLDTGSLKKHQRRTSNGPPMPPPPPSNLNLSKSDSIPIITSSPIQSRLSRSPNRRSIQFHSPPNKYSPGGGPHQSSPTYVNTVLNERNYGSSRSPSPKKTYGGRSPLFSYGDYSFDEVHDISHDYYDYDSHQNDDGFGENESSYYPVDANAPVRNDSTTTSNSRTVDFQDYSNEYYDDERNYDDYDEATLTSTYFDYSILPELPNSAVTEHSSQPSSPGKRIALTTAISFYNKKPYQYQAFNGLTPSIDKKRLDFELPPVPLDLPRLPFSLSLLATNHFLSCEKIWSLHNILLWCLQLKNWLHDQFIPKKEFKKSLIKLLVFHRSDIPLDVIGQNVDHIMAALVTAGALEYKQEDDDSGATVTVPSTGESAPTNATTLKKKEIGVVFHDVYVSGVLTELLECYCHDNDHRDKSNSKQTTAKQLRCYSSQCYLNKVIEHRIRWENTNINEIILGDDWATHWKLTAEDLRRCDKAISKRQSLIFDLFRSEQTFIQKGSCFVQIVGPEFIKAVNSMLGGSSNIISINRFEDDVLQPGSELVQIHEKSLFEPLLRIMISEGKFVKNLVDIGNIYFNWSQVVKLLLLKYISTIPMTEELLKNDKIKSWVDSVGSIPRVKQLKINGHLLFLSTFNSRYQHLPLQLTDIRSLFDPEDQEYVSLTKAIDGIKKLGGKVNEMKRHADNIFNLKRISKQLVWKPPLNLGLINMGLENRRFIYRGDLIRKGDLKITSSQNHVLLMDNYFIITERVKNSRNGYFGYKVIENPIPVDLLLVEIKDSNTPTPTVTAPGMVSGATSTSIATVSSADSIPDDDSTYLFKIRFAGRGKNNAFIFSTKSERERMNWISQLIKARSNICERVSRTEVYSLDLIANTSFAYEPQNKILKLQVCAPNDPIEPASTEAFNKFQSMRIRDIYSFNNAKYHIIFGKVQNMVSFTYKGAIFYLVGLASGVYCSNLVNGWKKVIQGPDISKISVDAKINIVVILGNKHLRYYLLDLIIGIYFERKEKMASVSLSNDSVSFFSMATHRAITMLFYAKKKTNSATTNFKVLIPETDNDGVFSAFKVAKKFYVQAECYGISIFNSSFAVFTNKGFEILELDKLLPRSIPEIPASEGTTSAPMKKVDGYSRNSVIASSSSTTLNSNGTSGSLHSNGTSGLPHPGIEIIRKMVQTSSVRPMGMFKLSNNSEFLLVYNDCAIFTNKHGKLSRYLILRFDFRAKKIAFVNNNLIIVCDECLEIWSISDFVQGSNKLIQVIVGKDVTLVSNEGGDELFVTLANPKVPGLQLIYRLIPKYGEFLPVG